MILITGAAGKTGKQLLQTLVTRGESVRCFVRNAVQQDELLNLGAREVVLGDLMNAESVQAAFAGVKSVYHICPNVSPDEVKIGRLVIAAAQDNALERFVYHSVLHPQVEAMPHHWAKMQVEGLIFQSGLQYTILQPAAYMQNVHGYWQKMMSDGVYAIPYAVTSRSSMVDLREVAQVAAMVLCDSGHAYATYELCGLEWLSAVDITAIISRVTGKEIHAERLDPVYWEVEARNSGMRAYAVETLLKMFYYYENYDFIGNGNQLGWLLGRAPTRFETFVQQMAAEKS
ncbi:MAG: nucleoside-diphosphate sugar epimerase [Chloroflexi bacterium HGW-Chloroflexi-10]|nr:MAG: nucleoside-diphosphate sugar epimerase [Chloroflexi bacterium HGW-Chloroflexi-10]